MVVCLCFELALSSIATSDWSATWPPGLSARKSIMAEMVVFCRRLSSKFTFCLVMEGDESIDTLETDEVSLNAYGSVVEADQNVERSVHSEVGDKNLGRRTRARFQQKEKKLARRFSSLWQIAFSSESSCL